MLRASLLWLSEQPRLNRFVRRNRLASRFASRFVAGETAETALLAVRELNQARISASLDLLGESVHKPEEAAAARAIYLELLDRSHAAGADANVSVKLTQMGLDIDEHLCVENLRAIIGRAKQLGSFVRLDMEGSGYTQKTLDLFTTTFFPEFGNATGVVLQSYLRRTAADVEVMIASGARVRLCKGAYKEPESVAFQSKLDVDKSYVRSLNILMSGRGYPMIATHDPRLIAIGEDRAKWFRRQAGEFEFQMLYGVRPEEQRRLAADGYQVRVYVPYGTEWYGYLMRRLAERPANVVFFARAVTSKK